MTDQALTALKASIEHWKRMKRDGPKGDDRPYAWECPLCQLFLRRSDGNCNGCPVQSRTGQAFCAGSPFQQAFDCFENYTSAWELAAQAEIEFLESLLPK